MCEERTAGQIWHVEKTLKLAFKIIIIFFSIAINFAFSQEEGLAELENRSRWLIRVVPPENLGKTELGYKEWSTSYVINFKTSKLAYAGDDIRISESGKRWTCLFRET